jgi:hypothetical protein
MVQKLLHSKKIWCGSARAPYLAIDPGVRRQVRPVWLHIHVTWAINTCAGDHA